MVAHWLIQGRVHTLSSDTPLSSYASPIIFVHFENWVVCNPFSKILDQSVHANMEDGNVPMQFVMTRSHYSQWINILVTSNNKHGEFSPCVNIYLGLLIGLAGGWQEAAHLLLRHSGEAERSLLHDATDSRLGQGHGGLRFKAVDDLTLFQVEYLRVQLVICQHIKQMYTLRLHTTVHTTYSCTFYVQIQLYTPHSTVFPDELKQCITEKNYMCSSKFLD